jgi:peptidoglycan/LPS O-acetylase OafA/YrhL
MALAVISVVLADREHQPRFVRLVDRKPWLPWVGAAVAYWASGIGGGTAEVDSSAFYVVHQELNTIVAVGLFLPAILGDPRRGWLRRLLARRSLVWMGTISYGFYLWHLAVMAQFASMGWLDGEPGALAFVVASFAVTVALGALSYYGVGRYFLRLGERLPREVASEPGVSPSRRGRTLQSDR